MQNSQWHAKRSTIGITRFGQRVCALPQRSTSQWMPAKRVREQHFRRAQNVPQANLDPEIIASRTKKHLDELERTNYADSSRLLFDEDHGGGGGGGNARARQTISDKRNVLAGAVGKKKKSSMNVRTALLYRKNLATLIEESGIANLPPHVPTYLTAVSPPSREPPRLLCSVCGYWGRYKCKRCAVPYCDMACEGVHAETRCERRVI